MIVIALVICILGAGITSGYQHFPVNSALNGLPARRAIAEDISTTPRITKLALDEYCSQVVSGNYSYSSQRRVQKYLRMCRDAEKYLECILAVKKNQYDPLAIVHPYERRFPMEYDLQRATYMFCSEDMVQIQALFKEDVSGCEKKFNNLACDEFVTLEQTTKLESERNMEILRQISCNMSAHVKECIENQYTKCDSKYELFKDYELGTLGGECLQSHGLYSSYVLTSVCGSMSGSVRTGDNWSWTLRAMLAITSLLLL